MARKKQLPYENSCLTPIFQNVAFFYEDTKNFQQSHDGLLKTGRYGRYDNPLWLEVEKKIAALDGYDDSLVFSSGMNAITSTLFAYLKVGDKIIYTKRCYRNTHNLFNKIFTNFGIQSEALDQLDPNFLSNLATACDDKTRLVFLETPSNPHLYQIDLAKVRQCIGENTLFVVDSTIATPINMQPKIFGADLVIHSCTKYMNGHGNIIAGSVSGSIKLIESIRNIRNITGGILDAQSAYLLNSNIDTLPLRMQHFNQQGLRLARYLENNHQIKRVFYSGLESHPHYHLAQKYLQGHGGVITFELDADKATTAYFIDSLNLPFIGSNFGSINIMIEQCAPFTYYKLSQSERDSLGITDNLIRLSLAYEPVDNLIDDINQALNKL